MAIECPALTTSAKRVQCRVDELKSGYLSTCADCPAKSGSRQPRYLRADEKWFILEGLAHKVFYSEGRYTEFVCGKAGNTNELVPSGPKDQLCYYCRTLNRIV